MKWHKFGDKIPKDGDIILVVAIDSCAVNAVTFKASYFDELWPKGYGHMIWYPIEVSKVKSPIPEQDRVWFIDSDASRERRRKERLMDPETMKILEDNDDLTLDINGSLNFKGCTTFSDKMCGDYGGHVLMCDCSKHRDSLCGNDPWCRGYGK